MEKPRYRLQLRRENSKGVETYTLWLGSKGDAESLADWILATQGTFTTPLILCGNCGIERK